MAWTERDARERSITPPAQVVADDCSGPQDVFIRSLELLTLVVEVLGCNGTVTRGKKSVVEGLKKKAPGSTVSNT